MSIEREQMLAKALWCCGQYPLDNDQYHNAAHHIVEVAREVARTEIARSAGGGETDPFWEAVTSAAEEDIPVAYVSLQSAPAAEGGADDEETARQAHAEADVASWGVDGAKWAAAFRQTAVALGYSDMDEGWLIGWFANAIERSVDQHPRVRAATARISELEAERDNFKDWTAAWAAIAKARSQAIEAAESSLAALRAGIEHLRREIAFAPTVSTNKVFTLLEPIEALLTAPPRVDDLPAKAEHENA